MTRNERSVSRRALLRGAACGLGVAASGCLGNVDPGIGLSDDGPPDTDDMDLALEDSFEEEPINADKWRTNYPWGSRQHNYNGYVSSQNVYVYDGKLIIKAENKESNGAGYTTGMAASQTTFEPGYVEASVKIPPTNEGFWPALWLAPVEVWPPEIDLFEFFGTDPRAWMSYHYLDENDNHSKVTSSYGGPTFSDDYHRFGVDWNDERIVWYIDDEERFRYDGKFVEARPMWLIFNFGIDPEFLSSPRAEDLPAELKMREVRVWER